MVRQLTPRSSLEHLKREAKRWLKALHENDPDARTRLERVSPKAPSQPTLRDVQLALAREFGLPGWTDLKARLERNAATETSAELQSLLEAAEQGDAARVEAVLDSQPQLIDERGTLQGHTGVRTALHFGVQHRAVVKVLLDRGADPNIRDEGDDAMPLHFAAERGDMEIVRMLVEHGADTGGDGTMHELNALGWAICWDYVHNKEVADYLLAHGAQHTIHTAVALGDVPAIREAARRSPGAIDLAMDRTNQRRRPVHLAVIKKQPESVAALISLGADLDANDAAGLTALDQAALDGQTAMATALVEGGARIGLPAAVALGRRDDVLRLLREDPDCLRPGNRWGSLIVRAAGKGSASLVERLISLGASPSAVDDSDTAVDQTGAYTPLHAAAMNGNLEVIEVLLEHRANVRIRDSKYCGTPAGWANYFKQKAAFDLIMTGPVDVFDAIDFDRPDLIPDLLRGDAAAIDRPFGEYAQCADGPDKALTPLEWARKNDKAEAVRVLLEHGSGSMSSADRGRLADTVEWFLENACPDHHVRGASDHAMARGTALRILEKHPGITRESLTTAVVCGEVAEVERLLVARPDAAREKRSVAGRSRAGAGGEGDRFKKALGPKTWEPLLFLCFTRLPLDAAHDNALTIARMLLDHGADPNAFFMAGDSRYTPLVGVIGEGEEDRPPHPRRNELVRLLLESGANPYDQQVVYNMHFNGDLLWFLELIYERSIQLGRKADWDDPAWEMLNMGNYGNGARCHLEAAIKKNDVKLAEWCLSHGASPNPPPAKDARFPQVSLHELALRGGCIEIAELLVRHGAKPVKFAPGDKEAFADACFRLDRASAEALLRKHAEYLQSTDVIFKATKADRADVVAFLLDLGMSPNVQDGEKQRPLHIAGYDDAVNVARLLIDRGAEIDMRESNYGNTPLDCAVYFQNQRMIDLLAPHSRDVWNLTYTGHVERLRELVAREPDLAKVVWDGWTPLMWLTDDEARALEIVRLFLDNGADPAIRNKEGLTAADYAEKRAMSRVAELLRPAGR